MFNTVAVCLGVFAGVAAGVEYNVTTRDGINLRTSVDFPTWTPPTGGANLTAVLDRSPYGARAVLECVRAGAAPL